MASLPHTGPSTWRVITIPRRNPTTCHHQNRTFTATSRRSATRFDLAKIAPKQQSTNSRIKQLKRSEIPSDIGFLPGTFIRPTWREGPSLLSSKWRQRLTIDWLYLKQSVKDFVGKYVQLKWQSRDETGKKITKPMSLRERSYVAWKLHQDLYSAISRGDKAVIRSIACSGLAQQQNARIDRRRLTDQPAENWTAKYRGFQPRKNLWWTVQSLLPWQAVTVIADRQVDLPFGAGVTLRQFTVRIKSKQQLDKKDGSAPIAKSMTEYLVVQRMIVENETMEWKVWGTIAPSTYKDAMEIRALAGDDKTGTLGGWWDSMKTTAMGRMT